MLSSWPWHQRPVHAPDMRRVLFFIHIPKTAGTAFRQMLWRNLRSRLIEVPHVFLEGPIEEWKIRNW
jgi:hypothetical protein